MRKKVKEKLLEKIRNLVEISKLGEAEFAVICSKMDKEPAKVWDRRFWNSVKHIYRLKHGIVLTTKDDHSVRRWLPLFPFDWKDLSAEWYVFRDLRRFQDRQNQLQHNIDKLTDAEYIARQTNCLQSMKDREKEAFLQKYPQTEI
jgi:hypothetical protein